jgi:hypothetical protein
MNYMAKCPGECSSFAGDTGKPWFKVAHYLPQFSQLVDDMVRHIRFSKSRIRTAFGRLTRLRLTTTLPPSRFRRSLRQAIMYVMNSRYLHGTLG